MRNTRFTPTRHSAQRLAQRFFPNLNERAALERLSKLAQKARPLRVKVAG